MSVDADELANTEFTDKWRSLSNWRYLATGKVVHALNRTHDRGAVCGVDAWPSEWLGTGNQREYERADDLPLCRRCLRKLIES